MSNLLLLKDSCIFEESNLIDQIRQSCIDIEINPNENEIHDFLLESFDLLRKDIEDDVAIELFSVILSCFSHYSQILVNEIDIILKNAKLNANYSIIASALLYYLNQNQPQLIKPEYNTFIDDMLQEITLHIKEMSNKGLIVYGHIISPKFINDFLMNLLLSSKLTHNVISCIFPYILYNFILSKNDKFNLLFENINNFGLIQILPQNEESNEQIFEVIKSKNFDNILTMNECAFSLIQAAIFYVIKEGYYNVDGITEETILPFISIVMIYIEKIQKTPYYSFKKFKELITNSVQILINNQSPVLNASIDFILQNQFRACGKQLISNDDMFQLFFILTKQLISDQYSANKIVLLNSIFSLTSMDDCEMLSMFFNEFIIDLFNFILHNFEEIDNYEVLKKTKLNLMYIESTMIVSYLVSFSSSKNVIKFVYFMEKFCYNLPIIVSSSEISNIIMKAINEKIKEECWDDVIILGDFLKKNDFSNELLELSQLPLPKIVKNTLFNCIPEENCDNDDKVDYLLSIILSDPNVEKNDSSLKALFDLMVTDKDILQGYLSYLFCRNYKSFTIEEMLMVFKKEYELYNDVFIDVINHMFYNNLKTNQFLSKTGFLLSSLPISNFGQSIIFKLFDSIKKKSGNYEAFICLKHISSSFPFLFNNIFEQVCEIVSMNMKKTNLFFDKSDNDEEFRIIKTTHTAISFFVSVLQSSSLNDKFMKWFFNNTTKLNDDQLFSFLIIIYYIFQIEPKFILFTLTLKFNMLEKFGQILERESQNELILGVIKQKIYFILLHLYDMFERNNYVLLQVDEMYKKVDSPMHYTCDYLFSEVCSSSQIFDIGIDGKPDKLTKFMNDVDRKRDYWIDCKRIVNGLSKPSTEEFNKFCEKLVKNELLEVLPDIKKIQSKITIKMARYIVMKPYKYYSWILYNKEKNYVEENKEEIEQIINDLNNMQNEAKENPEDEENNDVELFNNYEYTFPCYCQQVLFKNLVKNLTEFQIDSKAYKLINQLIMIISVNEVSYVTFLEFISQYFSEIYDKCNECNIDLSVNSMINLLNALILLSENKIFKDNFVDLCGNNLINIILKPKMRCHSNLLLKAIDLFIILGNNLPIRVTQIICFMFSFKNIDMNTTFQLIKAFDYKKLDNVKHYIFTCFEKEKKNQKLAPIFVNFCNIFPSVIQEKNEQLYEFLDEMLQKYFTINENENCEISKDISSLIDLLAPKRSKSTNLMINNENMITIPDEIKETSPPFWHLFEKYSGKIINKIETNPFSLDNFKFLCEYPEIINFKIRSSYFRKKMRKRINQYGRFPLRVNRKNILSTSYKGFLNKSTEQILKDLCVDFDGEQSIDEGGPRREWFTELIKEIMNQNYGLFECSKNTKCYQPSRFSDINPNHIEYFKFAGKFVARALIEGQCIDAHFTSSFYKQILKCELNYKDVEDFDEELYKNLDWMLNNDVDPLCMFFEIDTKEFGIVKTIELKENGSKIKVTNENKAEYVNLRANYSLKDPIEQQVKAFCSGFYSLVKYDDIKMFTPKELDLLICGIPEINASDFIANTKVIHPYNTESPVIKYFFDVISKWENEKLAKLLLFMTGSSRVPSNGFKEFCEMSGHPLTVAYGGNKTRMPQSHTCFNTIDLPQYESEDELKEKLILAIEECNTFEMS